jgi:hypothetical protein
MFNKICVFGLVLLINSAVMAQNVKSYEVKEVVWLLNKVDVEGLSLEDSEQLSFNLAFVYMLKDGKVVIIPSIGEKGLLIQDESSYLEMLNKQHFPVEDDGSFFAPERHQIKEIKEDVSFYISQLKVLGVHGLPDEQATLPALKELSTAINNYGKDRVINEFTVAIGIYLGEIVRRRIEGQWNFERQETLNPYWIPYIELNDKASVDIWESLFYHFKKRKKVSLVDWYNELIKNKKRNSIFLID